MPDVQGALVAPWGTAQPLASATVTPWGRAARVQTFGTAYTPPASPPEGESFTPNDLTAPLALGPADTYHQAHTLAVTDLRTGTALQVDSLRLTLDDGAAFWTLSAEGPPALYAVLTGGEQPALLRVELDGHVWAFVVETVTRPRRSTPARVGFGGRSVAAVADAPYQFALTYSADAPTTAAQLCAGALLAAGVALDWKLADWLIPAGAVSIQGTPMDVVRAVAGAVGAVVTAHPSDYRITVQSRYELLPNEWAYAPPDVQLHSSAVESETFDRADKPAYTGVFVAGQQGGALGYVRLEGTSGGDQAPMVTDPLLTEEVALTERARSVFGAGGQQARVSRVVPVCTAAGQPGVFDRGQLVRCVDAAENGAAGQAIWHGMVRSVVVNAQMPVVQQTLGLERHTKHIVDPETADPLVLVGEIEDQVAAVGAVYLLDLTPYRSGGLPPYTWSLRSGALPEGVSIVGETLVGTAVAPMPAVLSSLRVTDAVSQMQDTPQFSISAAAASAVYLLPYIPNDPILLSQDGGASWEPTEALAGSLLRMLKTPSGYVLLGGLAKNPLIGNANYPPYPEFTYVSLDAFSWLLVNNATVDGAFSASQRPGYPAAAVSDSGRIVISNRNSLRPPTTYFSDDGGATWSTSDTARYFNLLWSSRLGLFIGTGFNLLKTSPTGASGSWTFRSYGGTGQYGSYACDDGTYVMVTGTSGSGASSVSRSADGITWTQLVGVIPGPCRGLAAIPGCAVAQQTASPFLLFSLDGGATWSAGSGLGAVTGVDSSSEPVWAGSEFLVFCNTAGGWRIYASADGQTWSDRGPRPTGTVDPLWAESGPRGYMTIQAPDATIP